jgi:hypothetical protein
MKNSTAMILFVTGLILTMAGVGGIEHSIDNAGLVAGIAASAVGLLIMYAATLAMKVNESTDYYE